MLLIDDVLPSQSDCEKSFTKTAVLPAQAKNDPGDPYLTVLLSCHFLCLPPQHHRYDGNLGKILKNKIANKGYITETELPCFTIHKEVTSLVRACGGYHHCSSETADV